MRNLTLLLALLVFAGVPREVFGKERPAKIQTSPAPQQAIAIADANLVNYGGRFRITRGAWDYLKITLRDTFKVWGYRGAIAGANLLLDPGYNVGSPGSAGLARTTPMLINFGRVQNWSRSGAGGNCGTCSGSANYNCDVSGGRCNYNGLWDPLWCQVRRPGFSSADNPWLHPDMYGTGNGGLNYFHEFGFYVAPVASASGGGLCPTATVYYDFTQQQVCTTYFNYDNGSGKTGPCSTAPFSFGVNVHYNARVFIFPNMRQEYAQDPVDGWVPPVVRGPYSGYDTGNPTLVRNQSNCAAPICTDTGNCNTCVAWICVKNGDVYRFDGCGYSTQGIYSYYKALPQTIAANNPSAVGDMWSGSYYRQGDDTALYFNVLQMQVQSIDRPGGNAFPVSCGGEEFYTGNVVGGKPQILLDDQPTANCMRPKSYYNLTTATWTQCDPFDTWNTDGTLNPANDDSKWMYPGHPVTGGFASPGRCGAQPCTVGTCPGAQATGWTAGAKTADLNDIFREGGGWYLLKLASGYPALNPGSNRIDIRFTGQDIRAEVGIIADVHTAVAWIDINVSNKKLMGRLRLDDLILDASLFLYNIDDTSCNPTYPKSCTGMWRRLNDNVNNPDKMVVDVVINNLDLVPAAGDWFVGDCDGVVDVVGLVLTMCDIINDFIRGTIETALEDALKGMIAPALADITSTLPNLNAALGDPISLGTVLVDPGFYLTGAADQSEFVPPSDTYTKRWPVYVKTGPTAAQHIVDMRMALGFKPIAFKPSSGANWNTKLMEIDTNDPPLSTSVYGIPTLYDPDTSMCAKSDYCNTVPNPDVEVHTGCSRVHAKMADTDSTIDNDDFCQGGTGSYRNQKTGVVDPVADAAVIKEHWEGPIRADKKPPAWCLSAGAIGAPTTLRTGATAANLTTLYPRNTWLSFHPTLDPNPVGGAAVAQNTIGNWDQMPGGTVLQQNFNTGISDPAAITYDFSAHIHQRVFAQFMQTLVASGVGCIEFAGQDTMGVDTPFKSFLGTERFAAFMPELATLFPGWNVKIQMSPLASPRVRTGIGTLTYTPTITNLGVPVGDQPLPIIAKAYTLGLAIPDIRLDFLVENPAKTSTLSVMTIYWSPVAGFYAKAVRRCYYLDPLASDPQCTSTFTNVRTVSGYYEIFMDMNSASLKTAFEGGIDGFAAGAFSEPGLGLTRGSAAVVISTTYCQSFPSKCKLMGLAQALPELMNSMIQIFLVTRLNFYNLTVDFLYVGPDGPNDDGKGGGDYLGIYARFLGNLNVFGLLDSFGNLAPVQRDLEPKALIEGALENAWYRTNSPNFDVKVNSMLKGKLESEMSYTYRVDQSFWHTPINDKKLQLGVLTEGEHTLEVRAFEDTKIGATTGLIPTVFKFNVDTLPPEVDILPSPLGYYNRVVTLKVSDLQTAADNLQTEYSWNDTGDWDEYTGSSISVRGFADGRHVLRVRSTDQAGNTATVAREVVVKESGWGCGGAGCSLGGDRNDLTPWMIAVILLGMAIRNRRRSRL